ncbi:MAG: ankyrin repeat domain-containing protein [Mycobacteriales bacterium]
MPALSLPDRPDLDHLRQQARALQRAARNGDADALRRVAAAGFAGPPDPAFPLSRAQLVLAREYGFASWPRLKRYVEVVTEYRWDATDPEDTGDEPVADRFCRLACLTYAEDGPERWQRARRLLADHPDLTAGSVWAAAAATDVPALRRHLSADPPLARRRGGPHGWQPLFYLAYSRLDPAVPRDAVLAAARLLLDAGADPDEGYLWRGLPTPFTLLTGCFGEGEQGRTRQPRHPHSLALARLLLVAGADPNDGQALYNRMFGRDDDHLELLYEFGLGTGAGGVWRSRLGDALEPPGEMLRGQLGWAIDHGYLDRVRLLARHGVDVRAPFPDGATPAERAQRNGHPDVVDALLAAGAAPPAPTPVDALVGAALRADRAAVDRLRAADPAVLAEARRQRPGLIVWAAGNGRTDAVALLAELGFDVNARGRGDTPVEQPWETALHHAAAHGHLELARTLLDLGADPNATETRFGANPIGWARYFGQTAMVRLLTAAARTPD